MDEIWKDIEGYEGLYQVSNLGDVRSLKYAGGNKVKLLKQSTDKKGYKRVVLCKDRKKKNHWIHRLVAIAFIPNPNNLPIVNHIDECKSNNMVSNLEWCTLVYNNAYGTRNERISKSSKGKTFSEEHKKKISEGKKGKHRSEETKKKISEKMRGENNPFYGKHHSEESKKKMSESHKGNNAKPILMYDEEGNFIRKFNSIADANEYFGKDRGCSNIKMCLRGKRKTAYGYIFRYAEENDLKKIKI
jgi:group I intron endonuclease